MEFVRIVWLSIAAAVGYGILHDQVTARVCVEYFTIGHLDLFGTDDPTLLGLGWGIVATWWVGLILGVALGIAARAGKRARLKWRELVRPITQLMLVAGCAALLAGLYGYLLTTRVNPASVNVFAEHLMPELLDLPVARRGLFVTDAFAHNASYGIGFLGGILLCILTWRRRGRMSAAYAKREMLSSGL